MENESAAIPGTGTVKAPATKTAYAVQYGLWRILAVIPLIFIISMEPWFNINMPMWDQWDTYNSLISKHPVQFTDFWREYHGHRGIFPNIIIWILASLSGWDVRWEVMASMCFACLSATILFIQAKKNETQNGRPFPALFWLAASLLFFSLTQYRIWFWGQEINMTLQLLAVFTGMSLLMLWKEQGRRNYYVGAVLFGVLASYSLANGLLYWPVGALAIICDPNRRWRALLLWCIIAASVWFIYFYGGAYETVDYSYGLSSAGTSLPSLWNDRVALGNYLCVFLGAPFGPYGTVDAKIFGKLGLGLWCAVTIALLARTKNLNEMGDFYFLMSVYALLGAFMTAAARYPLGEKLALFSWYMAISTLFWISLLVLLLNELIKRRKVTARTLNIYLFYLIYLVICIEIGRWHAVKQFANQLKEGQAYFTTHPASQWSNEKLNEFYPYPDVLRNWLMQLQKDKLSIFKP